VAFVYSLDLRPDELTHLFFALACHHSSWFSCPALFSLLGTKKLLPDGSSGSESSPSFVQRFLSVHCSSDARSTNALSLMLALFRSFQGFGSSAAITSTLIAMIASVPRDQMAVATGSKSRRLSCLSFFFPQRVKLILPLSSLVYFQNFGTGTGSIAIGSFDASSPSVRALEEDYRRRISSDHREDPVRSTRLPFFSLPIPQADVFEISLATQSLHFLHLDPSSPTPKGSDEVLRHLAQGGLHRPSVPRSPRHSRHVVPSRVSSRRERRRSRESCSCEEGEGRGEGCCSRGGGLKGWRLTRCRDVA